MSLRVARKGFRDVSGQAIEIELEPITAEQISDFAKATRVNSGEPISLTFATRFRQAEYQWLERLNVDLRYLLHGDQEYEYRLSLQAGDAPKLRTTLLDLKERKRPTFEMQFIRLETEIHSERGVCVVARTTFVVKKPVEVNDE